MIEELKQALEGFEGSWKEKKGVWEFKSVIAERKAFLSKKKLTYTMKVRVDDQEKTVKFTEMLSEAGSGLGGGDAGFGFQSESYNTSKGPREGDIVEQSTLFGKKYEYKFDYKEIRSKVEEFATKAGFTFKYQISAVGL